MHSEKTPNETEADEDRLVQQAIDGDSQAFGRLYDMYIDRVYRHIFYRIGNTSDTEDLTQQVFIKAWQAISRFKKMSSPFLAWLMTISNHLVIDFYRAHKETVLLEEDFIVDKSSPGPECAVETSWAKAEVHKAIRQLPPEQQQVVMLRYIEGFSGRDTAAAMDKSEEAIRVMLYRALKRLRRIMENQI